MLPSLNYDIILHTGDAACKLERMKNSIAIVMDKKKTHNYLDENSGISSLCVSYQPKTNSVLG